MANKLETTHSAEAILFEEERNYSRDEVTVLSGENLKAGAVVAKLNTNSKYVEWDPSQSAQADDSTKAAGVLVAAVDASLADKKGVVIVRHAIVRRPSLVYNTAAQQSEKVTAEADLAALGILTREGV